jgi:hypothetical protein
LEIYDLEGVLNVRIILLIYLNPQEELAVLTTVKGIPELDLITDIVFIAKYASVLHPAAWK